MLGLNSHLSTKRPIRAPATQPPIAEALVGNSRPRNHAPNCSSVSLESGERRFRSM